MTKSKNERALCMVSRTMQQSKTQWEKTVMKIQMFAVIQDALCILVSGADSKASYCVVGVRDVNEHQGLVAVDGEKWGDVPSTTEDDH
jgi:hypothetical protein